MKYGTQIKANGEVQKIPIVSGSKKDMKELTKYVSKSDQVSKILTGLGKIDKKLIGDKEGNLDLEKFNAQPEVKKAIAELKKIKVTKKWLLENGFMPASMILFFDEAKK